MRKKIDGLTLKEEIFCEEYLIDLNSVQAAIRAGYSPSNKSEGPQMLLKPLVKRRIAFLMKEREQRCQVSADRVLQEIAALAFSNISSFIEQKRRTVTKTLGKLKETYEVDCVELREWKAGLDTRAIASIKSTNDGIAFKLCDKNKSLELLGRHLNLFAEDNKSSGWQDAADKLLEITNRKAAERENSDAEQS